MAKITKHYSYFKLLFFIIITSLIVAAVFHIQGVEAGSRTTPLMPISVQRRISSANQETNFQEEGRIEKKKNRKRLMIGSVAPTCTYNECRGCKYKCRAEQVPVEGNDPINSAYHYKCVCHR